MKYFLESQQMVTLSSSQMVDAYKKSFGINDGNGNYYLQEYYNEDAKIGSQVVSGTITNAYNYVTTKPFNIKTNVGKIKYRYNPNDDDRFQLEVITKQRGGNFIKTLYYINRPVDQWYNMAFYKTVLANNDGSENETELRFALNNVEGETSGSISSKSGEIFRCYVSDDAIIDGSNIEFDLGAANNFNNWKNVLFPKVNNQITSLMQNWKSLYNITFDKCLRTCWDCKYTNDPSTLANSYDETEDEYSKINRRNILDILIKRSLIFLKNFRVLLN